ncbi:MAG: dTDP-4-dehydrorhamnose reductase, partial [Gammaproteobacteria bacterium]
MRILLIGREGQLAWELRRTLACLGEVIAIDRGSRPWSIDLSDPDSIRTAVRGLRPKLIVNAAAYTGVDIAEKEEALAAMINGVAPGILAEIAVELNAGLIHYSTDYVFSGEASEPYEEENETAPLGVYGRTKRQGEVAIEQVGIPHLILRTAWVYGTRGHNFLLTMLRLMGERDSLSVVSDQQGSPSWSREIAECTAFMIAQCQNQEADCFELGDRSGIYHMTNSGLTNWYEFAKA